MQIRLNNTIVTLLPQKALFLEEASVLVIADVHLGKAAHFRKAGIFMPAGSMQQDFSVMDALITQYRPRQVWFLGDLFHSSYNAEWLRMKALIHNHSGVDFILIKGNHDILDEAHYAAAGIEVIPDALELDGLVFSHEPLPGLSPEKINIAGHIHPGCMWRGRGKQSLRLPCFYLLGNTFLLPAFGALTGLYMMDKTVHAHIFAVLPDQVLRIG